MRVYIAGAALLASVWAAPAFAQGRCAQFQVIGNGPRTDYNPFDPSGVQDNFEIRVEGLADGVKRVRFLLVDTTLGTNGPGIGPNGPADYDVRWLEDTTRTVFVVGNDLLNPTNGAEARLPGMRGVDIVRFRLNVPRGQSAPAGTHRENLQIRYQCLNSAGVQIGTAFMLTPEAKTAPLHRAALKQANDNSTVLTNVFTGRPARGIVNRIVREVGPMSADAPAFPRAAEATQPLRGPAEAKGSTDFTPLWSGQAPTFAREMPAGSVIAKLVAETDAALKRTQG